MSKCKALNEWTTEDQKRVDDWKRTAHNRMKQAASGQELFEAVMYNCTTLARTIVYLEMGLDLSQDGMSPNGIRFYQDALMIARSN